MNIEEYRKLCIEYDGIPGDGGRYCIFKDEDFEIDVFGLKGILVKCRDKSCLGFIEKLGEEMKDFCNIWFTEYNSRNVDKKYVSQYMCYIPTGREKKFISNVRYMKNRFRDYGLESLTNMLIKEYALPRTDKVSRWICHGNEYITIDYPYRAGTIHPTSVEIHEDYLVGDIVVGPEKEKEVEEMLKNVGCSITGIHHHKGIFEIPSSHIHIQCTENIDKVLEKIDEIIMKKY